MPTRVAVAWCTGHEMYVEESEVGQPCGMGGDCFPFKTGARILRKRVGYIDPQCEEHPIFFARKDYEAHVREDH